MLSVLWTVALALFVVFALLDFAGLLLSPTFVIPGIQDIASGQTANANLTSGNAYWTFQSLPVGSATGTWSAGGGPAGASDPFLSMSLAPGTNHEGMWYQPFRVSGSGPYGGSVSLDVLVQTSGALQGELIVSVDNSPSGLSPTGAVATLTFNGSSAWSATPAFDNLSALAAPGLYYLKVGFLAQNATSTVTVGVDNVSLHWGTDEFVILYLPLPLPTALAYSQDPALFLGWYLLLVAAIVFAGLFFVIRDRRSLARAFRAPLADVSTRLRSMGAWIAIAQAWMAVTFVQIAIILVVEILGYPVTSPVGAPTATNAWGYLYELANASVYEELVFRALLIGVPLALGSFVSRAIRINASAGAGHSPSTARRYLLGSFRYLAGGNLRQTSSRQALLAGWIFLFASAAIFGVDHAPSWGLWKVIPAMAAGLAFGYLFLRHGIGAAILGHFVNDYASALTYENVGGVGFQVLSSLLFLALVAAGAGFFLWYVRYGWQHLQDLRARYGTHVVRQPAATAPGPAMPPPTQVYGPPIVLPPPPEAIRGPPPPAPGLPGASAGGPPQQGSRNPLAIPAGYIPSYHPPPYGFPPVRFQCPSCGWVEAKYDHGHFTCLRCGRTT